MRLAETVTFGGSALDRAAHLRTDRAALASLLSSPDAGFLALWRGKPMIVDTTDGQVAPGWLPRRSAVFDDAAPPVFLGLDDGAPRFARDITGWTPPQVPDTLGAFVDQSEQVHPAAPEGYRFAELRTLLARMSPRTAELMATSKALLTWHATHEFCARCGRESRMIHAGWQRDCPACGARHFPRTDPVVIMLVTRGNEVLLGRSPGWPEGMYSLLAGFVEPGEPIEAAVRREVMEETGVQVGQVAYLASQPWAFPMSLMIGCLAEALTTEITLDTVELEDAMWVSREEVARAMAGDNPAFLPARKGAIAHFLLWNWLADRLD